MILPTLILLLSPAAVPTDCIGFDCQIEDPGAYVGFTRAQTSELAHVWPQDGGPDAGTWYEYVPVINCTGNDPDFPDAVHCEWANDYCETTRPDSRGPYSTIYRREADDAGPLGGWSMVGPTCYTDSVPPRSGADAQELTMEMILEQFHRTAFALPQPVIEPPDLRALVNLPVYFGLEWPADGFEPGEVDTTDIIGHEVRIRPNLQNVTYHFGDGSSVGPTQSLGGGYPDGDITHEYTGAGTVNPSIVVVYGGEVSVDGGEWMPIPGTATVDGPTVDLQVLESRNRLHDD